MVFLQGRKETGLEVGGRERAQARAFKGSGDLSKGHLELQAPLESNSVWQEN